jgi:hypothetical protein
MDSKLLLGCPLVSYKATFALELSEQMNLGVSAYPGVGGFVSKSSGSTLGYQLPVVGELYFGDME